ncbi:MAG: Na(+)/H(+) antiporter subunit D [Candidatus Rokuibacteriota bacterium]
MTWHPAWPYLVGALLVAIAPPAVRRLALLGAPPVAVTLAWFAPEGADVTHTVMGHTLVLLHMDPLARVFALVFALAGGLAALYGLAHGSRRLHGAAFVAAAAALSIALAGDWLTFYTSWELLAIASFVIVTDGGTAAARASALRYLLVHVVGGACLLAGIVWLAVHGHGLAVGPLALDAGGTLILLAFAVNAALPPLHAWLTEAYPESSPGGTVVLSAFATKAAVYALARVFPGTEALVWAGVTMALYGVIFAVLENDIRRLLAYHIVSQVGYMVAAVGMGTPLALSGAAAHAFCHILYKALLLMGAGAVVHATGRRRLTELGGLAGAMPLTFALYMVGALSISGAPLLNGFVSKSLIVSAAEADHREVVAMLLALAAVGTFLHTGLKLPYFTFAGPARGASPTPVPRSMLLAMTITAGLCFALGVAPGPLYALLPFPVEQSPYTMNHVITALELLAGTAVGFVLLRRHLGGEPMITLDFDRLYRATGRWVADGLGAAVARAADLLEAKALAAVQQPPRPGPAITSPLGYALLTALASLTLLLLT